MPQTRTKQKLLDGKPVFGVSPQVDEPFITEIIGQAGYDFILIDCQHAPVGPERMHSMIRGYAPTESDIIVRVVWNETWLINQALDMGADGVIIPLPNTVEEVEQAVAAAKYPPQGVRSQGPARPITWAGETAIYNAPTKRLSSGPRSSRPRRSRTSTPSSRSRVSTA